MLHAPKSGRSVPKTKTARPTCRPIRARSVLRPKTLAVVSLRLVMNPGSTEQAQWRPSCDLSLLSVMPWDVMIEFLQQLRAGRVDHSRWPVVLQEAMVGTTWFDKWLHQAIYWYLIEQIAERLKSGELRNPKIYKFNPDAVYDPKQRCKKSCDQAPRTNQALRTKHQEKLQTGIPPPGKKTSRKIT